MVRVSDLSDRSLLDSPDSRDKNRWISFTDLETGAEAGAGIRQVWCKSGRVVLT